MNTIINNCESTDRKGVCVSLQEDQTSIQKTFDDLDNYMKEMVGVRYSEINKKGVLKALSVATGKKRKSLLTLIENKDGWLCVFACSEGFMIANELQKVIKAKVMTESIFDTDDGGSCFSITTGFHYMNRERFYFYRSGNDHICEEVFEPLD